MACDVQPATCSYTRATATAPSTKLSSRLPLNEGFDHSLIKHTCENSGADGAASFAIWGDQDHKLPCPKALSLDAPNGSHKTYYGKSLALSPSLFFVLLLGHLRSLIFFILVSNPRELRLWLIEHRGKRLPSEFKKVVVLPIPIRESRPIQSQHHPVSRIGPVCSYKVLGSAFCCYLLHAHGSFLWFKLIKQTTLASPGSVQRPDSGPLPVSGLLILNIVPFPSNVAPRKCLVHSIPRSWNQYVFVIGKYFSIERGRLKNSHDPGEFSPCFVVLSSLCFLPLVFLFHRYTAVPKRSSPLH